MGLILALIPGQVRANQPWYADLPDDLHEPWSFSPMIGGAFGNGSKRVTSGEIALRWRYGVSPENRHGGPDPKLFAFGVALGTANLDTLEPVAFVGYHWLPKRGEYWTQRFYLNYRVDVGAGYRFADEQGESSPIINAKVAVGVLIARPVDYMLTYSRGGVTSSRDRFRSEIDFVIKAQTGGAGDWYVAAGIELDPLRFASDVTKMIFY